MWSFLRDSANGLPNTKLKGKSEWHPKLKKNVNNLLLNIEKCTDFLRTPSWRNNLTIRKLDDNPLSEIQYNEKNSLKVRIDTVHQVKGESISAVIYLARINDIKYLLSGPYTEEGRIGYVAITRARDLLLLGIPNSAEKSLLNKIEDTGFLLWD